jgi:broad specificity phosphatase PhoE
MPPPHGGGGGGDGTEAAAGDGSSGQQAAATTTAAPSSPPPPLVLTLHPSRHVKTLHLVRHAEGFHNVAGALDYANYKLEKFLDAHLTREGWNQAHALRAELINQRAAGPGNGGRRPIRPAVVLTSPLTRALETAAAAFGGPVLSGSEEGGPALLMRAQQAQPGVREQHPPISALGAPPFAAVELAREHLGVHPCDRRGPLSIKRAAFPAVDFDAHALSEEDELWRSDRRETEGEIQARALALLRLVAVGRAEDEVAVVSHSSLLRHMLAAAARDEGVRRPFANAELRTVCLVVSP